MEKTPRLAVMTFLEARNYGAYLQAYGLQTALKNLGFPSCLLDYSCPHLAWVYAPVHRGGIFHGALADSLSRIRLAFLDARRNRAFAAFARKNLKRSKRYYTLTDLQSANECYDAFLAGSDQVFSVRCSNLDTAYFLSFVDNPAKKLSYAASFGFDAIPPAFRNLYKALLGDFAALSLREDSGVEIVRELLGPHVRAERHVDPTLLLSAEDWGRLADQSRLRLPRDFLLLYNVYPPVRLFDEAFALARARGLHVVYIGKDLPMRTWFGRRRIHVHTSVGPADFVRCFRQARCVLTNSFHGTVFSSIFHRPFLTELANAKAFNHRADDFLARFALQDRALAGDPAQAMDRPVDWTVVDAAVAHEKDRAERYLREALSRPTP